MREKVLTVIVDLKGVDQWSIEDQQREMEELVSASNGVVVDSIICRVTKPTAPYLIGVGKVNEIANLGTIKKFDTVIFSQDLKGSQQRNIEEIVKVKTIDRTQLILDIFARRAKSQEGKLQVELAQLEYLLPRLVGKGVELSRLGGGIGTLGPGETKLEVDRRRIGQRVAKLKRGLKEVEDNRRVMRKSREDKGMCAVSLVGYTNAGKSTLLNLLTEAKQPAQDGVFTTLDSLSRQYALPNRQKVIVSDTVGFIHDLPHHLIESFKATLEEVQEASLLLHVLDISHSRFRLLLEAVADVLNQMGITSTPTITVLNKIDQVEDRAWLKHIQDNFENAVSISAKTGEGLDDLNAKMEEMLSSLMTEIDVLIPINRMDLVNLAHQKGQVYAVKYNNKTIQIRASVPNQIAGKFRKV